MHAGVTLVLRLVFQQILNCRCRVFPYSEAEKSSDGCSHLRRTFRNKPEQKGRGMKWKRQIREDVFFGNICLSVSQISISGLFTHSYYRKWGLPPGSRCNALTSTPKPFTQHSCLGKKPACYSCSPVLGSQGQHLQRTGGWWK